MSWNAAKVSSPEPRSRVLVVDDTVTYRRIMTDVVERLDDAEIVGTAPNGRIALLKIEQLKPDLVFLDVEMPEMDGLETLKALKQRWPQIGVVMVSGASTHNADITIKCLQSGAIDFVPKPEGMGMDASVEWLRKQISTVLMLHRTRQRTAAMRAGRDTRSEPAPAIVAPVPPPSARIAPVPGVFDVLAIGCSTGGPEALGKIIPLLPGDLGVPVLLVQHMPPKFTESLARNLDGKSPLTVKEAVDGEPIVRNTVYIAPGGKHMVVREEAGATERRIGINDNPPVKSCRPSVDVLFRSVANTYGKNILAVVLTGMGDDGSDGVATLKRKGCYCITQSAATCVVYGMPRAVDEAGLSDAQIALTEIASRIADKIRPFARRST